MAFSRKFNKEINQAIEIAEKYRSLYMSEPGVIGMGPGIARRKGAFTGKAAIIITVKEKLSKAELKIRGWQTFPKVLDNVPVDVVEYVSDENKLESQGELANVLKVKDSVCEEWLSQNNVTGIAVGLKRTKGNLTSTICIQIFVNEKLSKDECKSRNFRIVPNKIQKVHTDVIQMKPARANGFTESGSRDQRSDTLLGGLSTGMLLKPFSYGTLGCLAFDENNNPVALSNEHVWDGNIGEPIVQPGCLGGNAIDVSFQLDVCHPNLFFKIEAPNPLTVAVLSTAAVTTSILAGLSDEIDPTREGQVATQPEKGALTNEEYTDVKFTHPEFPLPGTAFSMNVDWHYERRTSKGVMKHSDSPKRKNPHHLRFSKLITDRISYHPDDIVKLFGVVVLSDEQIENERDKCEQFYSLAYLHPKDKDKCYPVILKPWSNIEGDQSHPEINGPAWFTTPWVSNEKQGLSNTKSTHGYSSLSDQLTKDELTLIRKNIRHTCVYYAEIPANELPIGKWGKWLFVQSVNDVPPGTDPLIAAQTIGGVPVSQNIQATSDVACGPFEFEDDGSFSIDSP